MVKLSSEVSGMCHLVALRFNMTGSVCSHRWQNSILSQKGSHGNTVHILSIFWNILRREGMSLLKKGATSKPMNMIDSDKG